MNYRIDDAYSSTCNYMEEGECDGVYIRDIKRQRTKSVGYCEAFFGLQNWSTPSEIFKKDRGIHQCFMWHCPYDSIINIVDGTIIYIDCMLIQDFCGFGCNERVDFIHYNPNNGDLLIANGRKREKVNISVLLKKKGKIK